MKRIKPFKKLKTARRILRRNKWALARIKMNGGTVNDKERKIQYKARKAYITQ